MGLLVDISTAAKYNEWANNRIYNALHELTDGERREDRRAFFRSIHNTMNHVLLADMLYRQRLEKAPITFVALDEIVHEDFGALEQAHRDNDRWYVETCDVMDTSDLDGDFSFRALGMNDDEDAYFSLPLRLCLTNLFQHQIHHRGQVHHMISHAGKYPPPVDVVKFGRGDVDQWTDRTMA